MKIALIGATGFVGSAVLAELLKRGHATTVLVRQAGKVEAGPALSVVAADALDGVQVAGAIAGHDAVISAYNPGWKEPRIHDIYLQGTDAIIAGAKKAGVRLLIVGGAGSLYVAPGVQLVDTPEFPADWKQGALAAREALRRVQAEKELDWTFVSPPVFLAPGANEGPYRLGSDQVLMAGDQPAGITVADLATAIVDEIETRRHVRQRFTVARA
jgi:putative NADH-flavin reductase